MNRALAGVPIALGCLLAAAPPPRLDSWLPFLDRRIVSPSGAHYAVLRAVDGFRPGPFSLHRRRAGAPPLLPTARDWGKRIGKPSSIDADPADPLLAQGTLPQLPMDAAVTDAPIGIVLFDQYASVGYGKALTFLDATGAAAWSLALSDLFGAEPRGAYHTVSSLWWSRSWGIDVERRSVWVLTLGHEFREVALATGVIATPSPAVIARWAGHGAAERRQLVLDGLLRGPAGIDAAAAELLAATATDPGAPLGIRLRAAIGALRAGAEGDWGELFDAALGGGDANAALYAASHLHEIAPERALPALRSALLHCEDDLEPRPHVRNMVDDSHLGIDLADAFRALGARGRVELRGMIDDPELETRARLNAVVVESMLGEPSVSPGFLALCRAGDHATANRAINLLIWRAPPNLRELLVGLLAGGSGDDGRIGLYFREEPWPRAVPALREALARNDEKSDAGRWLLEAVAACERAADEGR